MCATYVHISTEARRASEPLEMELQVIVSCMWVLRTKIGAPKEAVNAFSH